MAPTSRGERYRKIVGVLMEEGFGTLVDQLGLKHGWLAAVRGVRPLAMDGDLTPEQRLRRTMERLGPTFAKLGQALSVRPDLIPPSYAAELAHLQDDMEPFPFAAVRSQIEGELGEPLEQLFPVFEQVPVAAASIGQVHMAELPDGTQVAVKVQRPGVREVIDADLDILRTQARRVQGRSDLTSRYDLPGLVDEFSRVIHEECDYVHEAENCQRLARLFAQDEDVKFPGIYWDRTAETVLTMERLDGIPFNDLKRLDAAHVDRHSAARKGIMCYYEQIFMHGFYHADPHPGNLFAMDDGRVAFTDFGRCGELSEQGRQQVADLLVAIIEQDGPMMTDVLLDVSRGGSADTDIQGLQRDVKSLVLKYYDLELHEVDSREMVVEIMSLVGRHGLTMDSEFALLLTTLATIQGLGTHVDPDFHFVDSVRPFAERIVKEQLQPAGLTKGLASSIRRSIKAAQVIPEQVTRALQRVGDGNLSMTVRPGGFDPLMSRVEHIADRLAFALVVSAFVVGLSTLLANSRLPWWMEAIAYFALICATGVGVFFFLSLLLRRFRQRPPQ